MNLSDFKVGANVRIVRSDLDFYVGRRGQVTKVWGKCIQVKLSTPVIGHPAVDLHYYTNLELFVDRETMFDESEL